MDRTILLIGPMSAGKSTIAQCLSARLGLPRFDVDERRWAYYAEAGYDADRAREIVASEGMVGLLRYWKPFEATTVERVLAEQRDCVIDFGAGHSVYEDEALFARVEAALRPFPHVILLLPSPDLDESVAIVNGRFVQMLEAEGVPVDPAVLAVNAHFVTHPSNHRLAKITVYTKNRTPDETCAEIVQALPFAPTTPDQQSRHERNRP